MTDKPRVEPSVSPCHVCGGSNQFEGICSDCAKPSVSEPAPKYVQPHEHVWPGQSESCVFIDPDTKDICGIPEPVVAPQPTPEPLSKIHPIFAQAMEILKALNISVKRELASEIKQQISLCVARYEVEVLPVAALQGVGKLSPGPPQWILVSERLPEKNKWVLVNVPSYRECEFDRETVRAGYWWPTKSGDKLWALADEEEDWGMDAITHWMPLPNPPSRELPMEGGDPRDLPAKELNSNPKAVEGVGQTAREWLYQNRHTLFTVSGCGRETCNPVTEAMESYNAAQTLTLRAELQRLHEWRDSLGRPSKNWVESDDLTRYTEDSRGITERDVAYQILWIVDRHSRKDVLPDAANCVMEYVRARLQEVEKRRGKESKLG